MSLNNQDTRLAIYATGGSVWLYIIILWAWFNQYNRK